MEAERIVKPIEVFLKCPDCNKEMINITKKFLENYNYKCSICNCEHNTKTKYPYIKFTK